MRTVVLNWTVSSLLPASVSSSPLITSLLAQHCRVCRCRSGNVRRVPEWFHLYKRIEDVSKHRTALGLVVRSFRRVSSRTSTSLALAPPEIVVWNVYLN